MVHEVEMLWVCFFFILVLVVVFRYSLFSRCSSVLLCIVVYSQRYPVHFQSISLEYVLCMWNIHDDFERSKKKSSDVVERAKIFCLLCKTIPFSMFSLSLSSGEENMYVFSLARSIHRFSCCSLCASTENYNICLFSCTLLFANRFSFFFLCSLFHSGPKRNKRNGVFRKRSTDWIWSVWRVDGWFREY